MEGKWQYPVSDLNDSKETPTSETGIMFIIIIIIKVHYIHSSLNPVGSWKYIICYVPKVEKVILNSIYMLEILY